MFKPLLSQACLRAISLLAFRPFPSLVDLFRPFSAKFRPFLPKKVRSF